jgi:hypothetical protein
MFRVSTNELKEQRYKNAKGGLTPAAPDRLRRGYAAAFFKVSCFDGVIALLESAAGEPYR